MIYLSTFKTRDGQYKWKYELLKRMHSYCMTHTREKRQYIVHSFNRSFRIFSTLRRRLRRLRNVQLILILNFLTTKRKICWNTHVVGANTMNDRYYIETSMISVTNPLEAIY